MLVGGGGRVRCWWEGRGSEVLVGGEGKRLKERNLQGEGKSV